MNEYTVVNGNTAEVCEFDSHTTTKNINMNKEIIQQFKFESNYINKNEVLKLVQEYVENCCQTNNEKVLISKIIKKVYNYDYNK